MRRRGVRGYMGLLAVSASACTPLGLYDHDVALMNAVDAGDGRRAEVGYFAPDDSGPVGRPQLERPQLERV